MIEVVGNNLAAIVFCSELVRHGIPVRHISNQDSRLGGHFAGFLYKDKRIDLGMVLLEPRFAISETDIVEYQGQFGQQVNPFNHAVFAWLESRRVVLKSIPVLSHFKNQLIGDVIIADDLSFLDLLPFSERQAIISEITIRIELTKHHPRDKANSTYFSETSLRAVYQELYGPLFSKYLLGNLELLAGPIGPEVVAQFHRLLWAPLYYPENILTYLTTGNSGMPHLDFLVPDHSSVSQLIGNVVDEMRESSRYHPQSLPNDLFSSLVDDCLLNKSVETMIFADERELSGGSLNAPGTMIAVVVAEIDSSLELVVHNLDTASKWYRATIRGRDFGVVVIEVGEASPDETDTALLIRANQCASSMGLGTLIEPIILRPNIYSFTPKISASFRNRQLAIKEKLNGNSSCNLTNEITGSFNNQVCLGLSSSQVLIRAANK